MRCSVAARRSYCSFSSSSVPRHLPLDVNAAITKAISSSASLRHTNQIHGRIVVFGLHRLPFFSGQLIASYAKHFNPHLSRMVFGQIFPTNNVFLWNSVIRACAQNGHFSDALDIYSQMQKSGVFEDKCTFPCLLNACSGLKDLEFGKKLHERVIELGLEFDTYIANSLVNMYARCGSPNDAEKLFVKMPQRDLVSWNALISGYRANKQWEEALDLYFELRLSGLVPDLFTVGSVLLACGDAGDLVEGRATHGIAYKIGIKGNVSVGNALLSMYWKCDSLDDAWRVFFEMPQRGTATWNTMISACTQFGLYHESLWLFHKMVIEFKPDLLSVTAALHACGHLEDLEQGRSVHEYLLKNNYEFDATLSNVLITMYGRCGCTKSCQEVFEQTSHRDLVTWNSLIGAYIHGGCYVEGLHIFKRMKRMGVMPDSVTFVTLLSVCGHTVDLLMGMTLHAHIMKTGFGNDLLICNLVVDAYAKCGSVADALRMFESIKIKDVMSWNAMIAGSIRSGNCSLGLKTFRMMNTEGMVPDGTTMLSVLPACSFLGSKRHGKEIHGYIFKVDLEGDVSISNAMIEMYSKCGNLKNSCQVFVGMKDKDIVSWTTMIYAYGMHGFGREALKVFTDMEEVGVKPDGIAFIAVIYACSHAGLVDEGLALFARMQQYYQLKPMMEHYACVVDLLSRSGKLAEAEEFICCMPMKPDVSIWGALLSSCRSTGEIQIAERVSKKIMNSKDSYDAGYQVLVSNFYASTRKWDEVSKIRKTMKARGCKKNPGCSWIEIKKRVYVFGIRDQFLEQSLQIYSLLERLVETMAKSGYIVDKRFVLHDVEEDEKEEMLCAHSERLAIAFGLLNTEPGTPLLIMKNLRVCGDCHTVTKYISKIVNRELTVRDANRFHCFKEGACSCGDHW